MKQRLRGVVEGVLSRVPLARAAYVQRDLLQLKVVGLETTIEQLRASQIELVEPDLSGPPAYLPAREPPPVAPTDHSPVSQAATTDIRPPARPADLLEGNANLTLFGGLLEAREICALGQKGEKVLLPFDRVMYPIVANRSIWASDILEMFERHLDPGCAYSFLDIGANVGLFSLEIAHAFPNVRHFYCIEPDLENYRMLQYNLARLGPAATLWNLALSDADGVFTLYRDQENFGNYSLNPDAMRHRSFGTTSIRAVATTPWMEMYLRDDPQSRLIWKSDTQGHDELIISLTPMEIWSRVDFAVVELWRIRKPNFDRDAFATRIMSFPNRSIGTEGRPADAADVFDFLAADDWEHSDLYLWR